jgi:hypothetical protein
MLSLRILPLSRYDIILENDWIKHHSPIVLDKKKLFVKITTPKGNKSNSMMNLCPNILKFPCANLQALLYKSLYGVFIMIQPSAESMHNKLLYGVFIMIQPCAESNAQQITPNFVIVVLNRY